MSSVLLCCQATLIIWALTTKCQKKFWMQWMCPQSKWVSISYFKKWLQGATKIPYEDNIIFRLCCLSFGMQTLITPLTDLQMKYNQGAQMYSLPSDRGANNEVSSSFQCAEAGGPHPCAQGISQWSKSPSWETGVSSGSLQIAEQEEEEKACLCSCSWKCSI